MSQATTFWRLAGMTYLEVSNRPVLHSSALVALSVLSLCCASVRVYNDNRLL